MINGERRSDRKRDMKLELKTTSAADVIDKKESKLRGRPPIVTRKINR